MDAVMANEDGGGAVTREVGDDDPRRAPAPTPPPTPAPMHTAKKTAVSAKKRRMRAGLVLALLGVVSPGQPGAKIMTTCGACATGTPATAAAISGEARSSLCERASC